MSAPFDDPFVSVWNVSIRDGKLASVVASVVVSVLVELLVADVVTAGGAVTDPTESLSAEVTSPADAPAPEVPCCALESEGDSLAAEPFDAADSLERPYSS